jgi:hypothetical protein
MKLYITNRAHIIILGSNGNIRFQLAAYRLGSVAREHTEVWGGFPRLGPSECMCAVWGGRFRAACRAVGRLCLVLRMLYERGRFACVVPQLSNCFEVFKLVARVALP